MARSLRRPGWHERAPRCVHPMKSIRRSRGVIVLLLQAAVSAGLLISLLRLVPIRKIFALLAACAPLPLFCGFLLLVPFVLLGAAHNRCLARAQSIEVSLLEMARINLAASFYGFAFPGILVGGVTKWYKLNKRAPNPTVTLSVILVNRALDTVVTVALGVLFLLPELTTARDVHLLVLVLAMLTVSVGVLCAFLIAPFGELLQRAANACARPAWLGRRLREAAAALSRFRSLRGRVRVIVVVLITAKALVAVLAMMLFARSLGLSLGFLEIGWVRSTVTILASLPISVFGLGVREWTVVMALDRYSVGSDAAASLSLLLFAWALVVALAGGISELIEYCLRTRGAERTPLA
jgi:glycosyltransferase 2 family protein